MADEPNLYATLMVATNKSLDKRIRDVAYDVLSEQADEAQRLLTEEENEPTHTTASC